MITEEKKQTQAELVLNMLSGMNNFTSRELADFFKLDKYMIARRLSDLKNDGKVKVTGYRKCRVAKEMCKTWSLNNG